MTQFSKTEAALFCRFLQWSLSDIVPYNKPAKKMLVENVHISLLRPLLKCHKIASGSYIRLPESNIVCQQQIQNKTVYVIPKSSSVPESIRDILAMSKNPVTYDELKKWSSEGSRLCLFFPTPGSATLQRLIYELKITVVRPIESLDFLFHSSNDVKASIRGHDKNRIISAEEFQFLASWSYVSLVLEKFESSDDTKNIELLT